MGFESFNSKPAAKATAEQAPTTPESVLNKHEQAALEELRIPLESITEQLGEEIEKGTYSLVIGDDASGRIPALMVADIIEAVYERKGTQAPLVRFTAGSTHVNPGTEKWHQKNDALAEHVARIKADLERQGTQEGKKALFVTEAIHFGRSLEVLAAALKKEGIPFDVATIGMDFPDKDKDRLEQKLDTKIAYGMKGTPQIKKDAEWYSPSGGRHLSGVTKESKELFADPARLSKKGFGAKDQLKINASRARAKEISREIATKYVQKRAWEQH